MKLKERNINIDLVKCIAVFSVISVHFFLNNGFYDKIVAGKEMYIFSSIRTLFMICVPLFIITTGYLMKNKSLSKKYYFGLKRVIITYIISTLMIILYRNLYLKEVYTIKSVIKNIIEFNIGYCWYINMYLGLLLLIPFLNLIYNNLTTKRHKNILIITMLLQTSFQGIMNIKYKLLPNWWIGIYPITYYFIGCYLREYKINITKRKNIFLFLLILIISSIINIYFSKGKTFSRGIQNDWASILNVATSTLLFIYIINLKLDNINIKIKRIIVKISELSLAIYLCSAMVDNFLYFNYFKDQNLLSISGYLKVVPLSFTLSISMSIIVSLIYKLIGFLIDKVKKIMCNCK